MKLRNGNDVNYRIWFALTTAIFILIGFIRLRSEHTEYKVGPSSYWSFVFGEPTMFNFWESLALSVLIGFLIAIPATVLGWIGQAIVVVVRDEWFMKKQSAISN